MENWSGRERPKPLQFGNSLKQLSCLLSCMFFYIPIAPGQVNGMPTYGDAPGKEKYFSKIQVTNYEH